MNIQLLAIDLDGTTLHNDHHTISPQNHAALKAVVRAGIHLVPSTGRALGRLPKALDTLPFRYAITSNGAKVYDLQEKRELYQNTLPYDVLTMLFGELMALPIYLELYADGCCYTDTSREPHFNALPFSKERREMIALNRTAMPALLPTLQAQGRGIEKLNLPWIPDAYAAQIDAILKKYPQLEVTSSFAGNAEVNAPHCNKGAALAALCTHLQIDAQHVMALGDNGNDIEMLRFAGISAAPANAAPCVPETIERLPYHNEEDAVAYAVKKWIHI